MDLLPRDYFKHSTAIIIWGKRNISVLGVCFLIGLGENVNILVPGVCFFIELDLGLVSCLNWARFASLDQATRPESCCICVRRACTNNLKTFQASISARARIFFNQTYTCQAPVTGLIDTPNYS